MTYQTVGTLLNNLVILRDLNRQGEEAAKNRDRVLADQNTEQHQKNSDIEDPIRKHSYTRVSKRKGDGDRDEYREDHQGT
jgi:hypothetical protein